MLPFTDAFVPVVDVAAGRITVAPPTPSGEKRGGAEHDPEKHAPDLIRGGYRFSEKVMLGRRRSNRATQRVSCYPNRTA